MAVTNEVSDQIANTTAVPGVKNKSYDLSKVRFAYFTFTQGAAAGDAASTVGLAKIPAGRKVVLPHLSRLKRSAFGAARVLDIGHTGWTKKDGAAQAAAADVLLDGLDVSGAGAAVMGTGTNAVERLVIESKAGTTIQAVVAGGTIPAAATLEGYIAYLDE